MASYTFSLITVYVQSIPSPDSSPCLNSYDQLPTLLLALLLSFILGYAMGRGQGSGINIKDSFISKDGFQHVTINFFEESKSCSVRTLPGSHPHQQQHKEENNEDNELPHMLEEEVLHEGIEAHRDKENLTPFKEGFQRQHKMDTYERWALPLSMRFKIFKEYCSKHLTNILTKAKKVGKKTNWIEDKIWDGLLSYCWDISTLKAMSTQNREIHHHTPLWKSLFNMKWHLTKTTSDERMTKVEEKQAPAKI